MKRDIVWLFITLCALSFAGYVWFSSKKGNKPIEKINKPEERISISVDSIKWTGPAFLEPYYTIEFQCTIKNEGSKSHPFKKSNFTLTAAGKSFSPYIPEEYYKENITHIQPGTETQKVISFNLYGLKEGTMLEALVYESGNIMVTIPLIFEKIPKLDLGEILVEHSESGGPILGPVFSREIK
jgi:hypothetical protein